MALWTRRITSAALAVIAAGALASCGGDGEASQTPPSTTTTPLAAVQARLLDVGKVEREIRASVRDQRGVSSQVTCPKDVRQAKDENFVCLVKTKEFGTTRFAVVQTDDNGNVQYAAEQQ